MGREALGIEEQPQEAAVAEPQADAPAAATPAAVKPATKQARLVELLDREGGATLEALSRALGWQRHTVRTAMTGLRKRGYEVARKTPADGGPARYRIAAAEASDAA